MSRVTVRTQEEFDAALAASTDVIVKAKRVVVPCVEVDRFGDIVEAAK